VEVELELGFDAGRETGCEVAATTVASVRPAPPSLLSLCCSVRLTTAADFVELFASAGPDAVGTTSRYCVTAELPGGARCLGGLAAAA
jgi:hypothetical protein